MPFTLNGVVPWGRTFDEYSAMFALSEGDTAGRILGCGDGPASFNTEATARNIRVVSCDPIYLFSPEAIEARVQATYPVIMQQIHENVQTFVWDVFQTPERLGDTRMNAMQDFLADFERGKAAGRYVAAALPELPFHDGTFDLAVCSHFLFLYSEQFSLEFHAAAIRELCRVAGEARIFPLHNLANEPSPHVEPVMVRLKAAGYDVERVRVPYEFQKGAHHMLTVRMKSVSL